MNYGFVVKKMLFVVPVLLGAALAVAAVNVTSDGALWAMIGSGEGVAAERECDDKYDRGRCGALSTATLSLAAKEDCGDKDEGGCGAVAPAGLNTAAKDDCGDKGECGAVAPAVALHSMASFLRAAEKEECGDEGECSALTQAVTCLTAKDCADKSECGDKSGCGVEEPAADPASQGDSPARFAQN